MPKCTKICFAAGLCPDLLGQLVLFPRPPSRNGGLLLSKGDAREERGDGKGIPHKSSRVNTLALATAHTNATPC